MPVCNFSFTCVFTCIFICHFSFHARISRFCPFWGHTHGLKPACDFNFCFGHRFIGCHWHLTGWGQHRLMLEKEIVCLWLIIQERAIFSAPVQFMRKQKLQNMSLLFLLPLLPTIIISCPLVLDFTEVTSA